MACTIIAEKTSAMMRGSNLRMRGLIGESTLSSSGLEV